MGRRGGGGGGGRGGGGKGGGGGEGRRGGGGGGGGGREERGWEGGGGKGGEGGGEGGGRGEGGRRKEGEGRKRRRIGHLLVDGSLGRLPSTTAVTAMVFSVMAPLWLSRNAVSAASRPVAMRTSVWDIPEGEKLPANMPAVRVAPPAPAAAGQPTYPPSSCLPIPHAERVRSGRDNLSVLGWASQTRRFGAVHHGIADFSKYLAVQRKTAVPVDSPDNSLG